MIEWMLRHSYLGSFALLLFWLYKLEYSSFTYDILVGIKKLLIGSGALNIVHDI